MWAVLKSAVDDWFRHRSARLGAALAYYAIFSLGPLLLIITSIAGLFFGYEAVRGSLTDQFRELFGEAGGQAVEAMLKGASSQQTGQITAVVGIVLLLVAAVGVMAQLKDALNTIWEVAEPEDEGLAWYVRTYLASLAGVLALGFLLTVSLVVSTLLAAASRWLGSGETLLWQGINLAVSLVVLTVLFAMLFKWFPDTEVSWREVWPGALATAVLFNAGKFLIAWYIGSRGLESTYGAAASLVAVLIWFYYAAQIVLFGAELTHAYANQRRGPVPHRADPGGNA
jgi:membrane protein